MTSEYTAFLRNTSSRLKALHAADPFDVGQHVSYGNIRLGSPLTEIEGLPIILGPVGGGQQMPWSAVRFMGSAAATEYLRNLSVLVEPLRPSQRRLAKRVDVVISCNNETDRLAKHSGYQNRMQMADFAMGARSKTIKTSDPAQPLRVLWVSRLIGRKGLRLALEAFSIASADAAMTLTVVGGGPDAVLSEEDRPFVTFVGAVPASDLDELYDQHDVVLFTSLRDSGCSVAMEALARNVPVVCVDHHGAAFITDPSWARKISYGPASSLASRLADALVGLATNRQHIEELSFAAASFDRHKNKADRSAAILELIQELRAGK